MRAPRGFSPDEQAAIDAALQAGKLRKLERATSVDIKRVLSLYLPKPGAGDSRKRGGQRGGAAVKQKAAAKREQARARFEQLLPAEQPENGVQGHAHRT